MAGARSGFSMGLTRFSKHKELAIDFMRFLTSRRYNEKLNRAFRWFPAIRGAKPDPILEAFRPRYDGTYKVFDMYLQGDAGGPEGVGMLPGLYMLHKAFTVAQAGYACAIGLLLFFLIVYLTLIDNKYVRVSK